MTRVLLVVPLFAAATAATLTRLAALDREEDVAAAPIATSTPRGSFQFTTVPSMGGEVSPARRRFIARADKTCVHTDHRGHAAQAEYAGRVAGPPRHPRSPWPSWPAC